MGKPKDPNYWKNYRARRKAEGRPILRRNRDRTAEYQRYARVRPSRAVPSIPQLFESLRHGKFFSFWEDELKLDLVQEGELAKLEGRDPEQAKQLYRAKELAWKHFAKRLPHSD